MTTVPALSDEAAINQYTATSGQTDFNFTYMIFATADIKVYVNGVLKTEVTHYNVRKSSGAAIASSDLPLDGGKVVFTSGLVLNDEVTLTREIAIARLTGYSVAGAFRADVVNAEFTKGYSVMQQLRRDLERSIRLSAYDAEGGSLTLPENRASKYLAFNASGDLIVSAGTTEVPVSAFMETLLDDTTAAAARTTLGSVIGTNVQAWDAQLDTLAALASVANLSALAGLTGAANKTPYFTGAGAMALSDLSSNKNAVINGDLNIWQRGTSFSSAADGTFSADRWVYQKSGAMVHDISRSTDVPSVAQAGRLFNYSLLFDCTTADASIASGDYCLIRHSIEGYNWLPLAQKIITLSFWVKGTKTGIHCVSLDNGTPDRSVVKEFTINTTDTWEYKTLTFAASPSAGTWNYTSGTGLRLVIVLAAGSTFQTTPDTWQTGNYHATSNQVNATDSTSNNFRICGVQLEAGSVATPFEQRMFQEELSLCLRYFERIGGDAANVLLGAGFAATGTVGYCPILFETKKRASPTVTFSDQTHFRYNTASANNASTAVVAQEISNSSFSLQITVASGLISNDSGLVDTRSSGYIDVSSEL